jgi:hypothetical protein
MSAYVQAAKAIADAYLNLQSSRVREVQGGRRVRKAVSKVRRSAKKAAAKANRRLARALSQGTTRRASSMARRDHNRVLRTLPS